MVLEYHNIIYCYIVCTSYRYKAVMSGTPYLVFYCLLISIMSVVPKTEDTKVVLGQVMLVRKCMLNKYGAVSHHIENEPAVFACLLGSAT